jgi:hypothetical protein
MTRGSTQSPKEVCEDVRASNLRYSFQVTESTSLKDKSDQLYSLNDRIVQYNWAAPHLPSWFGSKPYAAGMEPLVFILLLATLYH